MRISKLQGFIQVEASEVAKVTKVFAINGNLIVDVFEVPICSTSVIYNHKQYHWKALSLDSSYGIIDLVEANIEPSQRPDNDTEVCEHFTPIKYPCIECIPRYEE